MKIKLLFIFLLVFSFGNAQINVSAGFEIGSLPSGWTTDLIGAVVTNSSSCGGTKSVQANLYSFTYATIYTSSYVSNGGAINISYVARKGGVGAFFGWAYLYYEVNGSGTWTQIASVYSDFSTCTPVNATILDGVIPNGASVKFRMQINKESGGEYLFFDDFSAIQQVPTAPQAIAEYTFDNTYNNVHGNIPFIYFPNTTTFVNDRNGIGNKALGIYALVTRPEVELTSLPQGTSERSISIWYKLGSNANYPGIFSYGTAASGQTFGLYLGSNGNPIFQGFGGGNDIDFGGTYAANTWHHVVITLQSNGNLQLYMNGNLLNTVGLVLNTIGTNFKLTSNTTSTEVDDLKIYNYALTQAEVTSLYNNNIIANPTPPTIANLTENVATSTVTIDYTLNSLNGTATSEIKYGLTNTSLTLQKTGFSTSNSTSSNVTINGLLPNTTYYYQVEATNIDGTAQTTIESFTTLVGQSIAEYNFDNTYNNINGNSPFTSNAGSSFVADRNGNSNAAINLTNAGIEASIPTLPFNGSSRTISIWAKLNTIQSPNNDMFSYGGIFTGLGFASSFNGSSVDFFGYSDDINVASSSAVSTWYHFVYTYDGVDVKIYKNGTLLISQAKNLNTAVYDIFSLGRSLDYSSNFNGAFDDLKIYNYALGQADITSLYSNNTLSSSDFAQNNLEVALYPNPVNDVLNIQTALELQSVEIYNIQGQKVLSSNQKQINVSDLASGMYMVRIQDTDNNIATKKIVIK